METNITADKTTEKRNRKILILLFFGVLMGALDISIVGPALPSMEKTLHINERSLSWIFSIFVLFNLLGTPVMAKLSDAIGRRFSYVLSIIIFGFGSIIVSLSYSFEVLLIGRAIQGAGASGIFPVASAIIGDVFPPEKRGRALGLMGAVFGIAFLIGPILAGVLLMFDWHWLFIINIPIAVVLIIFSMKLLPGSQNKSKFKFDWLGMFVLAGLLIAFTFAINNIDTKHFFTSVKSLHVLPLLLVALYLLYCFRIFEKEAPNPIFKLSIFKAKQVKLVSLIAIGTGVFETTIVFIPHYAIEAFNVSISTASFMLLPVIIAMAIASPVSGRMLDKFGSKIIVTIGAILVSSGLFMLSYSADSMFMFYISEAIVGMGLSMLIGASLRYILLNEVPASERTSIQGLLSIFIAIGQMSGAAAAGAVVASFGSNKGAYQFAYLLVAFVAFGILLISLFLKNRKAELATIKKNSETIQGTVLENNDLKVEKSQVS